MLPVTLTAFLYALLFFAPVLIRGLTGKLGWLYLQVLLAIPKC